MAILAGLSAIFLFHWIPQECPDSTGFRQEWVGQCEDLVGESMENSSYLFLEQAIRESMETVK